MRGDVLVIQSHHRAAAAQIADLLIDRLSVDSERAAVGIAGESGSGKSELAAALQAALTECSVSSVILQQDDYFRLPPRSNDARRRSDIAWVGPQEVDLDRLDRDVITVVRGASQLEKPLVLYDENRITTETLQTSACRAVLVEGTYVSLLSSPSVRIFIDRDYHQTLEARRVRHREAFDPFIERVLEVEHTIIRPHRERADILVTEDYSVREIDPGS